uniref:Uncharacterized protein n=1 Tax=Timema monikensis TaxID=170555 RepID=A0A7R9HN04_9NEOP|nr:unnamed protein product [Timema monikensis]
MSMGIETERTTTLTKITNPNTHSDRRCYICGEEKRPMPHALQLALGDAEHNTEKRLVISVWSFKRSRGPCVEPPGTVSWGTFLKFGRFQQHDFTVRRGEDGRQHSWLNLLDCDNAAFLACADGKVTLEYLQEMHDAHSDLAFCSEKSVPPTRKPEKLLTALVDKTSYIIHYRHLKLPVANKGVLGKLKEETKRLIIAEYVGLRPKLDSFKVQGGKEILMECGLTIVTPDEIVYTKNQSTNTVKHDEYPRKISDKADPRFDDQFGRSNGRCIRLVLTANTGKIDVLKQRDNLNQKTDSDRFV